MSLGGLLSAPPAIVAAGVDVFSDALRAQGAGLRTRRCQRRFQGGGGVRIGAVPEDDVQQQHRRLVARGHRRDRL